MLPRDCTAPEMVKRVPSAVDLTPTPAAVGPSNRTSYRKGTATRERIITEAQSAIFDHGFNRTSSREVARRSGVTFGVIQHHFGTYEALLVATMQRGTNGLVEALASAQVAGQTTREKLSFIADLLWEYFCKPEFISYVQIFANLVRDPDTSEQALKTIQRAVKRNETAWIELMERTFGRKPDELVIRRVLFSTMQGLAIDRWFEKRAPTYAKERRLMVDAFAAYMDKSP